MSESPDVVDTLVSPVSWASTTRACQRSLPTRRSKLSVCSASRLGTSSGSWIFAKEMRRGMLSLVGWLAETFVSVLEATKM